MSERRAPTIAFVPENRLSKILTAMNREAFSELVESAETEVGRIAPILGESLIGDVEALIRLCRQDEADIFGQCREIGWLALRIVESARLAKRPALADAARGVWEMIDALSTRGVWHTDALLLHIDALQALASGTELSPEDMGLIDRQLSRMREAIGAGGSA